MGEIKPKIFYYAPENSGVGWYRFHQPLENLKERGLIELRSWGFDFTGKKFEPPTIKELKEAVSWADILVFGRNDIRYWFYLIQMAKTMGNKKVLLDIDDNIYSITPYLIASGFYNPNGDATNCHEEIVKYVDGIIVSTPYLEEIYNKKNKTWIVPNGVKLDEIHQSKQHEGVNIGYLVSSSHLENAQIIESAIIRVLKRFSNVRFFYTKAFSGFMDFVPKEIAPQISYLPFYPLKDYLKYVNNLNLDIGLASLMDNDFNKCKSNIRILEYWQNKLAVIASPVGEYIRTIDHGRNGYLAPDDEWEVWLNDLIMKPEKRMYFIQHSAEDLKKYDITLSADKYLEILRELIK